MHLMCGVAKTVPVIRRMIVLDGFPWFCNMMSHIRLGNDRIMSEISVWLLHKYVDSVVT